MIYFLVIVVVFVCVFSRFFIISIGEESMVIMVFSNDGAIVSSIWITLTGNEDVVRTVTVTVTVNSCFDLF